MWIHVRDDAGGEWVAYNWKDAKVGDRVTLDNGVVGVVFLVED